MSLLSNPPTQTSLLSLPPSRTNTTAIRHPLHTARPQPRPSHAAHSIRHATQFVTHPILLFNSRRSPSAAPLLCTSKSTPQPSSSPFPRHPPLRHSPTNYSHAPILHVQIRPAAHSVTLSAPHTTRRPPTTTPSHSACPNSLPNPYRSPHINHLHACPALPAHIRYSSHSVTLSAPPTTHCPPTAAPLLCSSKSATQPTPSPFPCHPPLSNRL